MSSFRLALCAGIVISFASAGHVLASGGGGGGGDMPSVSAPSYDPAAEYMKGVAALNAQQYKDAERALNHVVEAAPKNAEAWRLLGLANVGQNDLKGARKAYDRAVKLDPDNIQARQGLGVALGGLKDAKAAEQLDWLKARAATCGTCADAEALKAATSAVESAMGGVPTAALTRPMIFAGPERGDRVYLQAVGLINERRYDEALASLNRAREAFGPHPDILTYQGYAWRKKGDYARAETYYRQALAIAPAHKGATEYYGELKVERGDISGAKALLARLDHTCAYGCAEAEELRRWIDIGGDPSL
ncbi:lipopolysaccharide assembly protein LapB [Phenylobacterium sp. Root700]|uniref:tetratricopeptide repeat protein n=1 Tax=Phenylobacterium sp. Root700 TaxID=1736591 RepID=UPI0009EB7CAA|nr:tetratricopeptide repeat protein [Phenylobacterium sp. Root700]